MPIKLTARNVTKIFDAEGRATTAVERIDLDVMTGEFICLLGPSGCGKTTVLNLFAGFETPTAGVIELDGQPVRRPGPERGVVFQEHALFPWLTVNDNVTSGKRINAQSRAERQRVAERYLAMVHLQGFGRHYPHQLSGGMRQRVAIARALANEPEILLMDEPFAALDAITRETLQRELIRIWGETGKTIVFVTHNIEEAVFLGDRIAVMTARPGRIEEIVDVRLAKPRDINSPEFNEIERRARQLLLGDARVEAVR
jgi:ABC-type nitrate/sulfonate/bicarbonate transport system ATPase subunit